MIRLLSAIPPLLMIVCLGVFAESTREKQLATDKASLAQDKLVLTQTVSRLTGQVEDLRADNARLQASLDARPATETLSSEARQSIDSGKQQLNSTERHVIEGNRKTITIQIASLIVLALGLSATVRILLRRKTREQTREIERLTADLSRSRAETAALQESFNTLLFKGQQHGQ